MTEGGRYARVPVRRQQQYWVYIATNGSKTLYTGVTNDLIRRMNEHRNSIKPGFTAKYRIDRLVYFETTSDVRAAIAREKQIKGWRRERKITLIEVANPKWADLSREWIDVADSSSLRFSE
jgi:putative endonuclease